MAMFSTFIMAGLVPAILLVTRKKIPGTSPGMMKLGTAG